MSALQAASKDLCLCRMVGHRRARVVAAGGEKPCRNFRGEKDPENDNGIKHAKRSDDPEPARTILCNAPGRQAEPCDCRPSIPNDDTHPETVRTSLPAFAAGSLPPHMITGHGVP